MSRLECDFEAKQEDNARDKGDEIDDIGAEVVVFVDLGYEVRRGYVEKIAFQEWDPETPHRSDSIPRCSGLARQATIPKIVA